MQIDYLQELMNSPHPPDRQNKAIIPILETKITHLQQLYNNGNPFPKALHELLFLAGGYCYVLDYGLSDSQEELQEYVREELVDADKVITRPFYAIDVYNGNDQFLFIYLDEGDDPKIHEGHYDEDSSSWISLVSDTLSGYIDRLIKRVKKVKILFNKSTMENSNTHDQRIAKMTFASVYPMYVNKVEKKGRTKEELLQVIEWLTSYNSEQLQDLNDEKVTFETFFQKASINPNASLITGVICGYRVENLENPLSQQVRYLDKLVDELAKGRKMEKILRG